MRHRILKEMCERMTDEEKQNLVRIAMNKNQQQSTDNMLLKEIRKNQQQLQQLIENTGRKQWYKAFGSDVAANVLTTSAFWFIQKMLAKR